MDIVEIECPNCGAPIERKQGEYFGKCPFCGVEIGFDEMKEEVQFGEMQNRINILEKRDAVDMSHRRSLDRWLRSRNIMMTVMGIFSFLGFMLVGTKEDTSSSDKFITGIGVLCMLIAIAMLFVVPIISASLFPGYRSPNMPQVPKENSKIRMWVKLAFTGILVCLAGAIIAYIVSECFGIGR